MDIEIPCNSVIEFFVKFSRFEYALKRLGYIEEGKDTEIRIKWDDLVV